MRILNVGNVTTIEAPAKVNLTLDILGKRADGFHEVDTVIAPVDLCDEIRLELSETPEITVQVIVPEASKVAFDAIGSGSSTETHASLAADPAWDIPQDASNLAARMVAILQQKLGETRGAKIRILKKIPAAAGLGGGSSNAAAAAVAYLCALGRWDRSLATQAAASLGSDIPLFLGNASRIGVVHATGKGDQCEVKRLNRQLSLIITHPQAGCSTAAIYREFSNRDSWKAQRQAASVMLEALSEGKFEQIGAAMLNALQFSAGALNPWIDLQLDLLRGCGLKHVLMSGSGSACFALDTDKSAYTLVRQRASEIGISRVFHTRLVSFPSIEEQVKRIAE